MRRRIISVILITCILIGIINIASLETNAANPDYSSVFNATYYAQHNPDLAAAGITSDQALLSHFVSSGMNEGRQGSEEFNVYAYMNRYPDLKAVYGNNLKSYYLHYINNGKAEGRNGRADGATTTPTAPLAPVTPTYSNAGIKGTVSDKLQSSAQYPYAKGPSFIGMQPGQAQTVTVTTPGRKVSHANPYTGVVETYYVGATTETKTVVSGSGHTADEIAKANYNPSGLTSGYSALTGSAKIGDTRVMCHSLGSTWPASQPAYYELMECYAITSKGVPVFRRVGSAYNVYCGTSANDVAVRNALEKVEPSWNFQQFAYTVGNTGRLDGDCEDRSSIRGTMASSLLVEGYTFVTNNHVEFWCYSPSERRFYNGTLPGHPNYALSLSQVYALGFYAYR